MKIFLMALVVVAVLAGGAWAYGKYGLPFGQKVGPVVAEVTPAATETTPPTIGGQTDEHGCIIPAGYSWCEAKQKCLRTWEEPCDSPTTQAETTQIAADMKALIVAKNKFKSDDITVTVQKVEGDYAKGAVNPANGEGGGGLWFGAKVNGKWQLVFDGNGIIPCDNLKAYPDYPTTILPQCFDTATQKLITR